MVGSNVAQFSWMADGILCLANLHFEYSEMCLDFLPIKSTLNIITCRTLQLYNTACQMLQF